jgi:hypothetical protein
MKKFLKAHNFWIQVVGASIAVSVFMLISILIYQSRETLADSAKFYIGFVGGFCFGVAVFEAGIIIECVVKRFKNQCKLRKESHTGVFKQ